MLQLQPLSTDAIPKALEKARHYRLLNEPWQAESICRDILNAESNNQDALLLMILAITDQFAMHGVSSESEAKKFCVQLTSEYEQKYYRGIIEERAGRAALRRATPRAKYIAYEYYRRALGFFKEAEALQPKGNQDAILRWNACVRIIQNNKLKPSPEEQGIQPFLDV